MLAAAKTTLQIVGTVLICVLVWEALDLASKYAGVKYAAGLGILICLGIGMFFPLIWRGRI
jgi:hypothetical protein